MVVVHAVVWGERRVADEVGRNSRPKAHDVGCASRHGRIQGYFAEMLPAHREHNHKRHQIRYPHKRFIPVQHAAATEDDLSKCYEYGHRVKGKITHTECDEADDNDPERRVQMVGDACQCLTTNDGVDNEIALTRQYVEDARDERTIIANGSPVSTVRASSSCPLPPRKTGDDHRPRPQLRTKNGTAHNSLSCEHHNMQPTHKNAGNAHVLWQP